MKQKAAGILVLAGILFSWSALADGVLTPKHGGRMMETNGIRLELVIANDRIDLHVTDHGDKPMAVKGASAKVLLLIGGQKVEVPLQAANDNLLSGPAKIPDGAQSSAVITVEGLPKRITARLPALH
ncbi:MAG: hypothetical protein H7839_16430 [Magnetococcus sp. YQC-5]